MAYGDTDSMVDPRSVFLEDIPGWEDEGPRPTAADQGVMTNSGIRHFLHTLEQTIDNGFVDHRQQNAIMEAITRSLKSDPNIVPIRSIAADSWNPGQWAAQSVQPGRLVEQKDKRRSITVVNNGGATVYVDRWAGVNAGESFPLAPGASVTITTTAEVWAMSPTVGATLAFFETYDN